MKSTPTPTATQKEKPHPCDVCFQSKFCLPIGLPQAEMGRIRDVIQATIRVQKGEVLLGIRIWLCLKAHSRPDSSSSISVFMSAP